MNTIFKKTYDAVLPAGDYFIGDISYFLHDSLDLVWKNTFRCGDGCFVTDEGHGFVVTKPIAGNGFYMGSNNVIYDVTEENIGVVPVAFGDSNKYTGCGTFHSFDNPVSVYISKRGLLSISSGNWILDIDTSDCGSDDSEEDGYDSCG
jgi:hypothetical protein